MTELVGVRSIAFTMRFLALLALSALSGRAGIINADAVDPSLFNLSVLASGLPFPAGVQPLPDGSVLVQTSPNYGYSGTTDTRDNCSGSTPPAEEAAPYTRPAPLD